MRLRWFWQVKATTWGKVGLFVRNSHKEKIPATGLADTRSMSFNFSKLKAPSQKLNTLYLTHSPPQPRSRRISIPLFCSAGFVKFSSNFLWRGWLRGDQISSLARSQKKKALTTGTAVYGYVAIINHQQNFKTIRRESTKSFINK